MEVKNSTFGRSKTALFEVKTALFEVKKTFKILYFELFSGSESGHFPLPHGRWSPPPPPPAPLMSVHPADGHAGVLEHFGCKGGLFG